MKVYVNSIFVNLLLTNYDIKRKTPRIKTELFFISLSVSIYLTNKLLVVTTTLLYNEK